MRCELLRFKREERIQEEEVKLHVDLKMDINIARQRILK
jgi:hypothetical protein